MSSLAKLKFVLAGLLEVMDIRGIREELGLTQEQLASKLGVSSATVYRWERGKTKPSPLACQTIKRLAEEYIDRASKKS